MVPLEVSLALRKVEFAVESMVWSIGLTLPFSSAWKIIRKLLPDAYCAYIVTGGRIKQKFVFLSLSFYTLP